MFLFWYWPFRRIVVTLNNLSLSSLVLVWQRSSRVSVLTQSKLVLCLISCDSHHVSRHFINLFFDFRKRVLQTLIIRLVLNCWDIIRLFLWFLNVCFVVKIYFSLRHWRHLLRTWGFNFRSIWHGFKIFDFDVVFRGLRIKWHCVTASLAIIINIIHNNFIAWVFIDTPLKGHCFSIWLLKRWDAFLRLVDNLMVRWNPDPNFRSWVQFLSRIVVVIAYRTVLDVLNFGTWSKQDLRRGHLTPNLVINELHIFFVVINTEVGALQIQRTGSVTPRRHHWVF